MKRFCMVAAAVSLAPLQPAWATATEPIAVPEQQGVVVFDSAVARGGPNAGSPPVSIVTLGETVAVLDSSVIEFADLDSAHMRVQLSDGKESWVPAGAVVLDAQAGAMSRMTPLYRRPLYVTLTTDVLERTEVVAVTRTDRDWCEVVAGAPRRAAAWVPCNAITRLSQDVALAAQLRRVVRVPSDTTRRREFRELLEIAPWVRTSAFRDDAFRTAYPFLGCEDLADSSRIDTRAFWVGADGPDLVLLRVGDAQGGFVGHLEEPLSRYLPIRPVSVESYDPNHELVFHELEVDSARTLGRRLMRWIGEDRSQLDQSVLRAAPVPRRALVLRYARRALGCVSPR